MLGAARGPETALPWSAPRSSGDRHLPHPGPERAPIRRSRACPSGGQSPAHPGSGAEAVRGPLASIEEFRLRLIGRFRSRAADARVSGSSATPKRASGPPGPRWRTPFAATGGVNGVTADQTRNAGCVHTPPDASREAPPALLVGAKPPRSGAPRLASTVLVH